MIILSDINVSVNSDSPVVTFAGSAYDGGTLVDVLLELELELLLDDE